MSAPFLLAAMLMERRSRRTELGRTRRPRRLARFALAGLAAAAVLAASGPAAGAPRSDVCYAAPSEGRAWFRSR